MYYPLYEVYIMTDAICNIQNRYDPSPITLDANLGVKRESIRPLRYRDSDFDEKYDHDTLLYDAFWSADYSHIILIAPPFRNLLDNVKSMRLIAHPALQPCKFLIKTLDRHSHIIVEAPTDTETIELLGSLGNFRVPIKKNLYFLFSGKKVLLTKSRNNIVDWIKDWACFYRDIHEADAILIYDNNSDQYSADYLASRLSELSKFSQIVVVDWPFKFGPQGDSNNRHWDSDYCEFAILEHARRMFLSKAKGVVNCDIDELLVSNCDMTIFDALERSSSGVLSYRGNWMPGIEGHTRSPSNSAFLRHRDFEYYTRVTKKFKYKLFPRYSNRCAKKWSVIPSRCPENSQWATHRIKGWLPAYALTQSFAYRHFKEISTSWKYARRDRDIFDFKSHAYDIQIKNLFNRVNWE